MLDLGEVTISFGERIILDNVSWHITDGEKVGLIGDNGIGKTTLLKIIDRQVSMDKGQVITTPGYVTGYLPQGGVEFAGRTLREEMLEAFHEVNALKSELDALRFEIDSSCDPDPRSLNRYADIEQQLQAYDVNQVDSKIHFVLAGLGFKPEEFDRPLEEFSGGWQMRAALGRLLIYSPEILLLDEPTNYLDIEARMWLIDFIKEYKGIVIMVCHDRYFLDKTVSRISDLENARLTDYHTNYSGYVVEKRERTELLRVTRARQEKELARQKRFIERFRYKARKASQVQSRIKQLKKFELVEVPQAAGSIHVVIPSAGRSGLSTLSLKDAMAGYGGPPVLNGIDIEVKRGDRLALVGPNGAGKSTLMKVLAGKKPLDTGERKVGHNVTLGFFAQDSAAALEGSITVLETVQDKAPAEFRPQLRNLLGAFGFSGDDIYKKVAVLSGGERSRLAVLALLLSRPNVLLLDEPTNHLDMKTKDVLLAALERFGGTVVFVSHDRYFLNKLATRIVEIGEGRIIDYPGIYEDYLWQKSRQQELQVEESRVREKQKKEIPSGKQAWEKRKKLASLERRIRKKIMMLQDKITRLESQVEEAQTDMQELYSREEHIKAGEIAKKHGKIQAELEKTSLEWEKAEEELERVLKSSS